MNVQKPTLSIQMREEFTWMVVYTRMCSNAGHYSALCHSLKDHKWWFHLNDAKVLYKELWVLNLDCESLNAAWKNG